MLCSAVVLYIFNLLGRNVVSSAFIICENSYHVADNLYFTVYVEILHTVGSNFVLNYELLSELYRITLIYL